MSLDISYKALQAEKKEAFTSLCDLSLFPELSLCANQRIILGVLRTDKYASSSLLAEIASFVRGKEVSLGSIGVAITYLRNNLRNNGIPYTIASRYHLGYKLVEHERDEVTLEDVLDIEYEIETLEDFSERFEEERPYNFSHRENILFRAMCKAKTNSTKPFMSKTEGLNILEEARTFSLKKELEDPESCLAVMIHHVRTKLEKANAPYSIRTVFPAHEPGHYTFEEKKIHGRNKAETALGWVIMDE